MNDYNAAHPAGCQQQVVQIWTHADALPRSQGMGRCRALQRPLLEMGPSQCSKVQPLTWVLEKGHGRARCAALCTVPCTLVAAPAAQPECIQASMRQQMRSCTSLSSCRPLAEVCKGTRQEHGAATASCTLQRNLQSGGAGQAPWGIGWRGFSSRQGELQLLGRTAYKWEAERWPGPGPPLGPPTGPATGGNQVAAQVAGGHQTCDREVQNAAGYASLCFVYTPPTAAAA